MTTKTKNPKAMTTKAENLRAKAAAAFDELGFIIAFEDGEITDIEEIAAGMQHLIDNGHAWILQGTYGRLATQLIQGGYCRPAVVN